MILILFLLELNRPSYFRIFFSLFTHRIYRSTLNNQKYFYCILVNIKNLSTDQIDYFFLLLNCSLFQINKYADLFIFITAAFQRILWDFEYIIIRIDSSKTIINKIESSVLDYGWSFFFFFFFFTSLF